MKILLLFLACFSFSFDTLNVPITFQDSALIEASDFNTNFDSTQNKLNRTQDTVENKFIRFTDISSGDSTIKRLQVDTIRSNPDVDSIKGNPFIDTITTRRVLADSVVAPVRGNVTGNVTGNVSGTAATVTGAAQTAITSLGSLTGLTVSGTSLLTGVVTASNNVSVATQLTVGAAAGVGGSGAAGDIVARRSATTGAYYFGETGAGAKFLYYDGTDFILAGGSLLVGTGVAGGGLHVGGVSAPGNKNIIIDGTTKMGVNGTAIDSVKVITGGPVDTLKMWIGGSATPFRLAK